MVVVWVVVVLGVPVVNVVDDGEGVPLMGSPGTASGCAPKLLQMCCMYVIMMSSAHTKIYNRVMKMKLSTYLTDWLIMHSRETGIKARTVDSYADMINRLITPALGSMDLETLTPDDIRHLLAGILDAGHERTAELVYTLLHVALSDRVPSALQGIKRPRHRQSSPKPWSDDQIMQYVVACRQHKHGLAFSLAIMLGMRRGEICGLRWRDIDWDYQEIHICNQRVRLASGALVDCEPKSETSTRTIPIPAALLTRLRAERGFPDTYVCRVTPSGLSHAHAKLVKQLGLPHIGLHGLRHSFATSSAKHVSDIRSLQAILGHSSYAVTANIYLHPDHEMLSRAIDTPVNIWYNV